MPQTNSTGDNQLRFIQSHQPGMKAGDYEITLRQNFVSTGTTLESVPPQAWEVSRKFAISGPRFALDPQEAFMEFPPSGSLGDHSDALPHLILNRSTLPWEREARPGFPTMPWLVLLVFDEAETPEVKTLKTTEIRSTEEGAPLFPEEALEVWEDPNQNCAVIDVPAGLLKDIMPKYEELEFLAHVRQEYNNESTPEPVGPDRAVLIASRLPAAGQNSVVHLVSVEGRYDENGFLLNPEGGNVPDEQLVRLVTLHSWQFACLSSDFDFRRLLHNLDHKTLRLPEPEIPNRATPFLSQGRVPMKHLARTGEESVSWYRGPLAPGPVGGHLSLPTPAADRLLQFDPSTGLFDVSYSAAWELGRMLALESKAFSLTLMDWKKAHRTNLKNAEEAVLHAHLPFVSQPESTVGVPEILDTWFKDLALLKPIPFNYIIPDPDLLPQESVRFFQLDERWLEAAFDGAFSVGRVTHGDFLLDCQCQGDLPSSAGTKTGFLLRSQAVTGWPEFEIEGYDEVVSGLGFEPAANQLNIIRKEKLAPDVLLVLFEGEVMTVDMHLHPGTMHFGLDRSESQVGAWDKYLRNSQGIQNGQTIKNIPVNLSRKVDIQWLAGEIMQNIPNSNIGTFSLEMVEGVEKIRLRKETIQ